MVSTSDIASLSTLIGVFYSGTQAEIASATASLAPVREHPRPWQLLEAASKAGADTPVILWCAALVEQWLRRRWRWLPVGERAACKSALVPLVVAAAAAADSPSSAGGAAAVHASKLESVLAQLLKQDWPEGWPSFLSDLIGANLSSSALLRVAQLLGEEVLPHAGAGASRAATVRSMLREQFAPVLHTCVTEVVSGSKSTPAALATLTRFAPWLPPASLLAPGAIVPLLTALLATPRHRSPALLLLVELVPVPRTAAAGGASEGEVCAAAAELSHALMLGLDSFRAQPPPREFPSAVSQLLNAVLREHAAAAASGAGPVATALAAAHTAALSLLPTVLAAAAASAESDAEAAVLWSESCGLLGRPALANVPDAQAARAAALQLLCRRMPRPPAVLVWADADGESDGWWDGGVVSCTRFGPRLPPCHPATLQQGRSPHARLVAPRAAGVTRWRRGREPGGGAANRGERGRR